MRLGAAAGPPVRDSLRRIAQSLASRSNAPASVAELDDHRLPAKDPWGRGWVLAVAHDRVIVVSPGVDGVFPSADDLVETQPRRR